MSKHTPGPWLIWKERAMKDEGMESDEINDELLCFDYFEVMSGEPIGKVRRGQIKGCKEVVELDAESFGDDIEEGRQIALANARLIAASPELLQALQLVAAHIPEIIAAGILTAAETDTIRAAITKAGG